MSNILIISGDSCLGDAILHALPTTDSALILGSQDSLDLGKAKVGFLVGRVALERVYFSSPSLAKKYITEYASKFDYVLDLILQDPILFRPKEKRICHPKQAEGISRAIQSACHQANIKYARIAPLDTRSSFASPEREPGISIFAPLVLSTQSSFARYCGGQLSLITPNIFLPIFFVPSKSKVRSIDLLGLANKAVELIKNESPSDEAVSVEFTGSELVDIQDAISRVQREIGNRFLVISVPSVICFALKALNTILFSIPEKLFPFYQALEARLASSSAKNLSLETRTIKTNIAQFCSETARIYHSKK